MVALAVVMAACDGDGSNLPDTLPAFPSTTVDGATTTTVDDTSTTDPGLKPLPPWTR